MHWTSRNFMKFFAILDNGQNNDSVTYGFIKQCDQNIVAFGCIIHKYHFQLSRNECALNGTGVSISEITLHSNDYFMMQWHNLDDIIIWCE